MTKSIESGEIFTAEVDMISKRSGLGSVKYGRTTIGIGPVTCEKGDEVYVKYVGKEKVNENTDAHLGICLTEHAISEGYGEYIERRISDLTPDEPPASGEVMYARIDEIEGQDMGIVNLGGKRLSLGPVRADVGDLVQISGVNDAIAEVLTDSARGDKYEVRFSILTGSTDRLPISESELYQSIIVHVEADGTPVGEVMGVPVTFPGQSAEVGRKVDARITGFERDRAVGKIEKKYDEVGQVQHLGHWGRMQWLQKVGFGDEPFRSFGAYFFDVEMEALPEHDDRLRPALIAEAVRLCLEEKATHSDEEYPRAHVTGICHWVIHKLSTVLGEPDNDDEWFRETLTDGKGQTLTFLGDVLELSNGYYAMAPSRAIMTDDSEAILISGRSTGHFDQMGLEIQIEGVSRRVINTSEAELRDAGLAVQSPSMYLGTDTDEAFDEEYLTEFIRTRQKRDWIPESEWEAYRTNRSYGFDYDDEPVKVVTPDGDILSLWRVPVQYGADEYQLKVESTDKDTPAQMVQVPSRHHKQISLLMDAMSGSPREIIISPAGEEIRISCTFVPPRSQIRWLTAVGARWEDPRDGQLHWRLGASDLESVEEAFKQLPVKIRNKTNI